MSASSADVLAQLDLGNARIRRAFLDAIRALVDAATVGEIERLIAAGKIDAVLAAIGMSSSHLSPIVDAVRQAFKESGQIEAKTIILPGTKLRIQFDMRNTSAERWIRTQSANLVSRITVDQREAIRIALQAGLEAGRNPRVVALDIIGRIDKLSGRRTGGIIGLNGNLSRFAQNARAELANPERMANYLTRKLRDRRFDAIVRRALRDGVPVDQANADLAIGRYSDRLLNLRGEMIARTEGLAALNAGREQSYQQIIDDGTVDPQNIKKTWETAHDSRVRESHKEMQGQTVDGIAGQFTTLNGSRLRFPGDTSLGAGPEDIINCRCIAKYKVDFIAQQLASAA